jgi:hypothetical protein
VTSLAGSQSESRAAVRSARCVSHVLFKNSRLAAAAVPVPTSQSAVRSSSLRSSKGPVPVCWYDVQSFCHGAARGAEAAKMASEVPPDSQIQIDGSWIQTDVYTRRAAWRQEVRTTKAAYVLG